jgi:hypothetical protein
MPFTVMHKILRAISKHVLVAELNANFWATSTESVALSTVNACPPARRIVGAPQVDEWRLFESPSLRQFSQWNFRAGPEALTFRTIL